MQKISVCESGAKAFPSGYKSLCDEGLSDFGYQPLEYGGTGAAVLAGGVKSRARYFYPRGYGRPSHRGGIWCAVCFADKGTHAIRDMTTIPYAVRALQSFLKRHEDEIEGTVKYCFSRGGDT